MKIKSLHSWDVTADDAVRIQKRLTAKLNFKPLKKSPKLVAGADIAFAGDLAFAGIVLLDYPSLNVVDIFTHRGEVMFPYVPGLLSFREAPILLELLQKITRVPDILFLDGHGYAHPRKLGLASHIGLFLDIPTIGCAKSRLCGKHETPETSKGSTAGLLDNDGRIIGAAIRTREKTKPLFVSAGNRIDLQSAIHWTMKCTGRFRIPEPTRLAHKVVTEFKRINMP